MMKQSIPVFPKPLNDLLQKIGRSSESYAKELAKKLARYTQATLEDLFNQQTKKIDRLSDGMEEVKQYAVELCKQIINAPPVRFEIQTKDIKRAQNKTFNHSSPAELIKGKAVMREHGFAKIEVDCVIASKNWHQLGEMKGDTINLIDYLDKLLPLEKKGKIGIVTFQNGMANTLGDFVKSSQIVFDQFTQAPLCIGLYNSTLIQACPSPIDMYRFVSEKLLNRSSVYSLCQTMSMLANVISKLNPNLLWVHFAHSEGGLIANAALEVCQYKLFTNTSEFLKNNLITSTYGAVKPIPDEYTKYSINTYSKNDIALFFGKNYIDSDLDEMIESQEPIKKKYKGYTYSIKVIDSLIERFETVKMPVEMPKRLSPREMMQLSFLEHLAYREEVDNAPWVTQSCIDLANEFSYNVKDHGFEELTYKEQFVKDAYEFKKDFNI
jgi:hypothetical protein